MTNISSGGIQKTMIEINREVLFTDESCGGTANVKSARVEIGRQTEGSIFIKGTNSPNFDLKLRYSPADESDISVVADWTDWETEESSLDNTNWYLIGLTLPFARWIQFQVVGTATNGANATVSLIYSAQIKS